MLAVPPAPGLSPNTRTLLQFRVVSPVSAADPVKPAWALPAYPTPAQSFKTRDLALYETVDGYGRLAQNLGTLAAAMEYKGVPTEVVQAGQVETWRIFNLTADTHPIHFHYFNVRVQSRQAFNMPRGVPHLMGRPIPPEPNEEGWKETVRMNPGECTTVLVDIPSTAGLAPDGVTIPESRRLAAFNDPQVAGAEYVWHCHILEHEEHDMMRPLVVQG
jgi:spore coat protein A